MNEEISLKLEDMEDSFIALKDFVFEKLEVFGEKLETLERTTSSDMSAMRSELQDLSGSLNIPPPLMSSTATIEIPEPQPSCSGISLRTGIKVTNSKYIEEIPEAKLRAKLMLFYDEQIDIKEKLSPLQLAYVVMWFQENPEARGSMLVLFSTDSVWKK